MDGDSNNETTTKDEPRSVAHFARCGLRTSQTIPANSADEMEKGDVRRRRAEKE